MNFRTAYKVCDTIARATGVVYRRAWRQWVYAIAIIGFAFVGQKYGINGVAIGVAFGITLNYLLMTQLTISLLEINWLDVAKIYGRHLINAFGTGIVLIFSLIGLLFLNVSDLLILIALGGTTAIIGLVFITFKTLFFISG